VVSRTSGDELKPGQRLSSTVCETEVVVVKAPAGPVDLRCGGQQMVAKGRRPETQRLDLGWCDGTEIGRRYADPDIGLEVLCTKAGDGFLSLGDRRLPLKDGAPLPH
jgi:hypothetical protein